MKWTTVNIVILSILAGPMANGHSFSDTPDWKYSGPQAPLTDMLYTALAPWDFDCSPDNQVELAVCAYSYDLEDPEGGRVRLLKVFFGRLISVWESNLEAGFQCLLWADLDGDGDDDLIAGTSVLQPTDTHSSVIFFENTGGVLQAAHTDLSSSGDWDVMDLKWGDFNFDHYPDLLVCRADGTPYLLEGHASGTATGWTLLPVSEILLSGATKHYCRASLWDTNNDDVLDIAGGIAGGTRSSLWALESGFGSYSEELMRRAPQVWFSVVHFPQVGSVLDPFLISGSSWDAGICKIIDPNNGTETVLYTSASLHEYNVEFASDIEPITVIDGFSYQTLIAVSEAGLLLDYPPAEIRHRRGIVLEVVKQLSDWSTSIVWSEPESELVQRRSESFAACWCDIHSVEPQVSTAVFQNGGNLFFLGNALSDEFAAFVPVFRIINSYRRQGFEQIPVSCWYSGNGWFGTEETIPAGWDLVVLYLTSDQPDLFFGRRNCVEGYEW